MIILEIIADIVAGVLDSLGGFHWLFARRYIMPFILGVCISIISHTWWLGLTILPVMGTLCLGYKNFGTGNFSRAMWLFVQAVVIGLGVTITGHLHWYFYVPYIIGAGVLGGVYKNWKQQIGDLVTGCWLGIIVFFVR